MTSIALLLGAIASLISALGGVVLGLAAMRRASPRERADAAENAAERLLATAHRQELEELLHHMWHQQESHHDGSEPGPEAAAAGDGDPAGG